MASVSVCVVCVFNIHSANIYYRCLFCGEYYASVGAWEKEKNQRSTLLGSFSYPPVEELCRQALVMLGTSCMCACVCPCVYLRICLMRSSHGFSKATLRTCSSFISVTATKYLNQKQCWRRKWCLISNSKTQPITEGSQSKNPTQEPDSRPACYFI